MLVATGLPCAKEVRRRGWHGFEKMRGSEVKLKVPVHVSSPRATTLQPVPPSLWNLNISIAKYGHASFDLNYNNVVATKFLQVREEGGCFSPVGAATALPDLTRSLAEPLP